MIATTLLVVAGMDGVHLFAARQAAVAGALTQDTNLARSLSEQLRATFHTIDTVLAGVQDEMQSEPAGDATVPRLSRLLQLGADSLGPGRTLAVFDARGHQIMASGPQGPQTDVMAAGFFRHHAADPATGLYVAPPTRTGASGAWAITASRRIADAHGGFAGVVVATIATGSFLPAFRALDASGYGAILLAYNNGVSIARLPADPLGDGRDLSRGPLFSQIFGANHATFEGRSIVDGRYRMGSYSRIPGVPALVMVASDREVVLAPWRHTLLLHLFGLAAVFGVVILVAVNLFAQLGEVARAQAALRRTNARLEESEAHAKRANMWLEMAEQIARMGHWHAHIGNTITITWSDELYRIHGLEPGSIAITPEASILAYHPNDRAMAGELMQTTLLTGAPFEYSARLVRPDGSVRDILARGSPQRDEKGAVVAAFGVMVDITDQKRGESALRDAHAAAEAANEALGAANRALEQIALQDPLTGLANRRLLDGALEAEFRRARRAPTSLAFVMLDVDSFKQFNDLYGHQAGDSCLRAIAEIIPPLLNRPGDVVARYGGEEIAVLLPGNTEAGALLIAHRIADAVRGLAIPHAGSPHGVVTVSAGLEAFAPIKEDEAAFEIVHHADVALYAAKDAGRDRVMAFRQISAQAGRGAAEGVFAAR